MRGAGNLLLFFRIKWLTAASLGVANKLFCPKSQLIWLKKHDKTKIQLFLSEKTLLYNKKSLPLNQSKVMY